MASSSVSARSGLYLLLVLGVIWGVTFPVAQVGVAAGASPFLLVALDFVLAAVVMAGVAIATRSPRLPGIELARSAGLGALLIGGINLPLYWGLRAASGATASIVYSVAPLVSLVVLVGLGTAVEVGGRQIGALFLGLAGVVLLGFLTTGSSVVAGIAALGAFAVGAICQGTGAVLVGRARPAGERPWGLTFQFVGGAVAAFVLLPIVAPSPSFPVTAATLASVAYVGIFTMAIGYSLFFFLIQRAGAVRANQVTFLNPVVAVAIGVLVFREAFRPLEIAALGLIFLALVILQPGAGPRAKPIPAPARPVVEARPPA